MKRETPKKPIIVGKIGSCYGIYGWLRVFSFTEETRNIFRYQPWFVKQPNQWKQIELERWRYHNQYMIFKLRNINNRNIASSLINCEIIVDSSLLSVLKEKDFYWKDLIGCQVITIYGYNLGTVVNIMKTGSNDVLIVKKNKKDKFLLKERLIPFLNNRVIKNINLTKKIIEVDWSPNF